jgi:hypothetical protein
LKGNSGALTKQITGEIMDIAAWRAFFMWCTILNGGLLMLSFVIGAFGGEWVYRIHSRFYPISREAFNIAMYSLMGLFKILVLVFNLIPFLALLILG